MPDVRLDVEGMRDLRRELGRLDDSTFKDELREINANIAESIVRLARSRASTPLQKKAAESLKAGRQLAKAVISAGGARYPFFGGAEFGADQNKQRIRATGTYTGYAQFPPWRGSGRSAGYFLYPTIRAEESAIIEQYLAMVDDLTRRAFPD